MGSDFVVVKAQMPSLQNIELFVDDVIVDDLIKEVDTFVTLLKLTDYQIDLTDEVTHDGSSRLVGISGHKGRKYVCFDLICSLLDSTIKQSSFMFLFPTTIEAIELTKNIESIIKDDFDDLKSKFDITQSDSSCFIKTIDGFDLKTIPYLIKKMRSFV